MTLIKTSLLNGVAVIIKMLTMLSINKILAIYVGPSGYAAIGNFQNAVQMSTALASGAINKGVTKYTAEYHGDEVKQYAVWRTAGTISLVGSVIVAISLIGFNKFLAGWFLKDESLGSIFIWFAATLVLFVFNTLLLAVLNGKKEIHRYVMANIAGSLFALAVTTVMTVKLGLYGALVALAIYQSLTFFATLAIIYKTSWFGLRNFIGAVDRFILKNLLRYSLMALVSVAVGPAVNFLIRTYIFDNVGADSAGLWEAMQRLGGAYIMFFTSVLSVYLLPKLSETKNVKLIVNEIVNAWYLLVPVSIAAAVFIYLIRDNVILLLFSDSFAKMGDLFLWHFAGEVLRLTAWILTFVMISKSMVMIFIKTEVIFNAFYFVLTVVFVDSYGLVGAAMSYALSGLIYIISMVYIFFLSNKYSFHKNRDIYE
ncbi:O-antigen translocase [Halomonas sp.]|uniref:O-antigen translocase n=1 Tax=Halomonas sp. TaxID=1486246 RepID=UPI00298D8205|nr:O-antigen translocase [Halomonas sp.]MDW7749114.1 O-antigen translocase [Halomonas sp.]